MTHSLRSVASASRVAVIAAVACAALLAGCQKGADKKAASQVAVKVNGDEISVHQVDLMLRRQPAVQQSQQDAVARRVVDGLVDQELAAQAARKDKLDQDPRVVQMMEAAKRDVLARAYLERLGETVTEPSSDEIDRYYQSHPNLFSQRRLYSVQETSFLLPADKLAALQPRVEAASGFPAMSELLRAESVQFQTRQISVSAEDVPMALLDRMAALKEGQSLMLTRDGAARVLTLLNSQLAPVAPGPAKRLITGYLTNERKRTALQQGVKALRDQAKVEYQGRFAELMAASAASAPATGASDAVAPAAPVVDAAPAASAP